MTKVLNAKKCLMDFACRTEYNEALAKYGVTDGAGLTTGLQEVPITEELLPTVPTTEELLPTVPTPTN